LFRTKSIFSLKSNLGLKSVHHDLYYIDVEAILLINYHRSALSMGGSMGGYKLVAHMHPPCSTAAMDLHYIGKGDILAGKLDVYFGIGKHTQERSKLYYSNQIRKTYKIGSFWLLKNKIITNAIGFIMASSPS